MLKSRAKTHNQQLKRWEKTQSTFPRGVNVKNPMALMEYRWEVDILPKPQGWKSFIEDMKGQGFTKDMMVAFSALRVKRHRKLGGDLCGWKNHGASDRTTRATIDGGQPATPIGKRDEYAARGNPVGTSTISLFLLFLFVFPEE